MSTLFNVVWFVFVGWWSALLFLVISAVFAVTVVGFPIAKALFQFAKLNAFPFGKAVIRETELKGEGQVSNVRRIGGIVVNAIWFPIGLILTVFYFLAGIGACLTIIGIPAGVVYVRMGTFVLFPLGAKVVNKQQAATVSVVNELEKRNKQ